MRHSSIKVQHRYFNVMVKTPSVPHFQLRIAFNSSHRFCLQCIHFHDIDQPLKRNHDTAAMCAQYTQSSEQNAWISLSGTATGAFQKRPPTQPSQKTARGE